MILLKMNPSLFKLNVIIDNLKENLKEETLLTVVNSIICVFFKHPTRETNIMDVLLPFSRIGRDFEEACKKAFIGVNSKNNYILNINLLSSDEVDIGEFKEEDCIEVYKSENLTVRTIPTENFIASQLVDINEQSLSDCVFLIRTQKIDRKSIKQVIKTLRNKKLAMKNFILLEKSKAFDLTPYRKIRQRVRKKLIKLKTATGLRNRYVDVVSFLLSGKSPSELLINKKFDTYKDLIEYIREGQPDFTLALHDPEMYKQLRSRITDLICEGWI